MHEQRLTTRLIKLWERTKGEAECPQYARFNIGVIDDIWQSCMALEVLPSATDKPTYKYAHCGDGLKEAVGEDLTGQVLNANMKFFPGAKIIKRIDEVVLQSAPTPLEDDGQFVNKNGKVVKYRACLLAFAANTGHISHVVVGVSWRAF